MSNPVSIGGRGWTYKEKSLGWPVDREPAPRGVSGRWHGPVASMAWAGCPFARTTLLQATRFGSAFHVVAGQECRGLDTEVTGQRFDVLPGHFAAFLE